MSYIETIFQLSFDLINFILIDIITVISGLLILSFIAIGVDFLMKIFDRRTKETTNQAIQKNIVKSSSEEKENFKGLMR